MQARVRVRDRVRVRVRARVEFGLGLGSEFGLGFEHELPTMQASAANGTMNINETGQLFADAGFFDSAYRC